MRPRASGETRRSSASKGPRGFGEVPQAPLVDDEPGRASWAGVVREALVAEADRDGLLAGEKSQHITFRAPPALVEAAKRNLGVTSTSELGMLALMMLAQPDPVAALMKKTRGALGPDHTLEC